MQQLGTTVLPGGIYGVEVRVIESGREISRTEEKIYKLKSWRNPERRLHYNAFGGVEKELANNRYSTDQGSKAFGVSANYLMHPKVIVGGRYNVTQAPIKLEFQPIFSQAKPHVCTAAQISAINEGGAF